MEQQTYCLRLQPVDRMMDIRLHQKQGCCSVLADYSPFCLEHIALLILSTNSTEGQPPTPLALRVSTARSRPSCRRKTCRACRWRRGSRTARTNSRKSSSPTPQVPLSSGGSARSSRRYFRERPLWRGPGFNIKKHPSFVWESLHDSWQEVLQPAYPSA